MVSYVTVGVAGAILTDSHVTGAGPTHPSGERQDTRTATIGSLMRQREMEESVW